ncbi:amidohydrolase [Streptomyces xanthophaeus]|uniref:amidohydrolase n=1 Tax=Streptomyces xanthophaeus TaxID=67385 RepID=UPI00386F9D65|nr:amidohydrolase [Streptomyces xanthophaeus]WST65506.1 amidohydrolase [Streptomyces xanthophaeus]
MTCTDGCGIECARRADDLWHVSRTLHADPELAYEADRAAGLLTRKLPPTGFQVELGTAGLDTTFPARLGNEPGRCVALLMEYDALPGAGAQACGHNMIAAAGLGVALALHSALDQADGTVLIGGTPAEERGGGKADLAEVGTFDGVDVALMFHPALHDWSWAPLTARTQIRMGFHGRAAHPTGDPTRDRRVPRPHPVVQHRGSGQQTPPGRLARPRDHHRRRQRYQRRTDLRRTSVRIARMVRGRGGHDLHHRDVTRQGSGYSHSRDNDVLSDRFSEHIAGSGVHLVRPGDGEHRSLHRQRAATGGEEGVISAGGLQCKAAQAANREPPVHRTGQGERCQS